MFYLTIPFQAPPIISHTNHMSWHATHAALFLCLLFYYIFIPFLRVPKGVLDLSQLCPWCKALFTPFQCNAPRQLCSISDILHKKRCHEPRSSVSDLHLYGIIAKSILKPMYYTRKKLAFQRSTTVIQVLNSDRERGCYLL